MSSDSVIDLKGISEEDWRFLASIKKETFGFRDLDALGDDYEDSPEWKSAERWIDRGVMRWLDPDPMTGEWEPAVRLADLDTPSPGGPRRMADPGCWCCRGGGRRAEYHVLSLSGEPVEGWRYGGDECPCMWALSERELEENPLDEKELLIRRLEAENRALASDLVALGNQVCKTCGGKGSRGLRGDKVWCPTCAGEGTRSASLASVERLIREAEALQDLRWAVSVAVNRQDAWTPGAGRERALESVRAMLAEASSKAGLYKGGPREERPSSPLASYMVRLMGIVRPGRPANEIDAGLRFDLLSEAWGRMTEQERSEAQSMARYLRDGHEAKRSISRLAKFVKCPTSGALECGVPDGTCPVCPNLRR